MINLCYVINVVKNQGPCNVIYNLVSTLPKDKYKLHLVTLYCGNDENVLVKFKKQDVNVKSFDYNNRLSCFLQVKRDLSKYCKDNSIDIVHSHTLFSDLSVFRLKNITKITTIHNRTFEDYKYLYGAFWGNIVASVHMKIFKKFDMCVCCSKSVFEEQQKYLSNNIVAIQNGISTPTIKRVLSKSDFNIDENACVFIYVGSLSKRKNVTRMIELFTKNRREDDYLFILGDGDEMERCKTYADSHVLFLGFIDNPGDYYAIGDIYISASLSEGLSISQLESMSSGLKQLVSSIPSHREIVDIDPVIGRTFDEDNFTRKYAEVVKDVNPKSRASIKKIFFENFMVENMMSRYHELYSKFGEDNES